MKQKGVLDIDISRTRPLPIQPLRQFARLVSFASRNFNAPWTSVALESQSEFVLPTPSRMYQPEEAVSCRRWNRRAHGSSMAADRAAKGRPVCRVQVAILLQDKSCEGWRPRENYAGVGQLDGQRRHSDGDDWGHRALQSKVRCDPARHVRNIPTAGGTGAATIDNAEGDVRSDTDILQSRECGQVYRADGAVGAGRYRIRQVSDVVKSVGADLKLQHASGRAGEAAQIGERNDFAEPLIQGGERAEFRCERGEKLALQVVKDRRQVSHVWQTRRSPSRSNKLETIPDNPGF